MASIKGATIPEWRERQLLRPITTPVIRSEMSPNRKELRAHIVKSDRIVPGTDRKLGDSPIQAKLRVAIRNAVELGTRTYERI